MLSFMNFFQCWNDAVLPPCGEHLVRLIPRVLHLDRKNLFFQFVLVQPNLQAPAGETEICRVSDMFIIESEGRRSEGGQTKRGRSN